MLNHFNLKGKITVMFTGFVVMVTVIAGIASYFNLRGKMLEEFATRMKGEISSFNKVIALDLMVGDSEAIESKMASYLLSDDLVAILVKDLNAEDTEWGKVDAEEIGSNWEIDKIKADLNAITVNKEYEVEEFESTFLGTLAKLKAGESVFSDPLENEGSFLFIGQTGYDEADPSLKTDEVVMVYDLKRLNGEFDKTKWAFIVGIFILAAISCLVGWTLGRYITTPINQMTNMIQDIAEGEGDLTKMLDDTRSDELGTMAGWFNKFMSHLRSIIKDIDTNSREVDGSAKGMGELSSEFVSHSEKTRELSGSVAESSENANLTITAMASAAEEISATIGSVSQGAKAMSDRMTSLMETIENLSESIRNVSHNANSAKGIAEEANNLSNNSAESMSGLGVSANEIGRVTEVIKRIAEQTNLLALNASIEAASAGEAGKGFSVVANEIKNLAQQSAVAAEEINQKIRGIQGKTTEAIQINSKIVEIITNINQSVTEISGMVTDQNEATSDMSLNVRDAAEKAQSMASAIAEVAKGSNGVSVSAAEAADVIGKINRASQEVQEAANNNESSARQTQQSSERLREISQELAKLVSRFKL